MERKIGDGREVQGTGAGLSRGGYLLDYGEAQRRLRNRPIVEGNVAAREKVLGARNGETACKESRRSSAELANPAGGPGVAETDASLTGR